MSKIYNYVKKAGHKIIESHFHLNKCMHAHRKMKMLATVLSETIDDFNFSLCYLLAPTFLNKLVFLI